LEIKEKNKAGKVEIFNLRFQNAKETCPSGDVALATTFGG